MNARLVNPSDQSYQELLGRMPHDIYHTPEYLLHTAACEGAKPVVFIGESRHGRMLVPLLFRKLPSVLDAPRDWIDARSPYGYAGPLIQCDNDGDATALGSFQVLLHDTLRDHNVISVFLRWHPLLSPRAGISWSNTTICGQTVYMDLTKTPQELSAEVRKGHRYEIRRLVKNGFGVVMNDWDYYEAFQRLYQATMEDVGAAESCRFPTNYFEGLRTMLGDKLHLGCVLSPHGALTSASLFMEECGTVQYHLSATDRAFRNMSPAKLLLQHVRDWSAHRNNRYFHLGGGLGANEDSLFRFKAGFSKSRAPFYVSRMIVDAERYAQLMQRGHSDSAPAITINQFFPSYRLAS